MDWIKKIFNKTKYYVWYIFWFIVYFTLGAVIVLYPIYNRLILEKLPRELPLNLISKGHYVTVACFLCILFIWIYILYKFCKPFIYNYLKIDYVPSESAKRITDLIKKSINVFYYTLATMCPFAQKFYDKIMAPLAVFLMNRLGTRHRMRWAIYITLILPRVIIMLAFFSDAIILHEMNYSYKIWPIYIIVFIERYIIYWTSLFKEHNLPNLNIVIKLYDLSKKSLMNALNYYDMCRNAEYEKSIEDEHYIYSTWFPLNVENTFHVILNPDWENNARIKDPNFDSETTLKIFTYTTYSYTFPISLFNEFYENLRDDIRSKFTIFQALFYVSLWTYIIMYIY